MEITTFTTTRTEHSRITGERSRAGVVFLGTTLDLSENHLGLYDPAQTKWLCRITSSLREPTAFT